MPLILILGLLGLSATVLVIVLLARIRRLTREAERRRRETAVALAGSARSAELRQRLLRGITHDLKNPLGAARGYAELLSMGVKGELNARQMELVSGVDRSIESALAIISDLLDLTRADHGGITVHLFNVDVNELITRAVDDHRGAATTTGHQITFLADTRSLMSYTDATRVRRIIDNLISNAIKYTPAPGRIIVRTEANATDAPFARRAVAIRVSDTGPGIPADLRERIFDEFTRLDDHSDMKGHGLGLSIARRLARLLGGELAVVDSNEPGSMFVLWLPYHEDAGD